MADVHDLPLRDTDTQQPDRQSPADVAQVGSTRTTLRPNRRGEMTILIKSVMVEAVPILKAQPLTLKVIGISQKPYDATDADTGEIVGKMHTRFICEDGSVHFTNSVAVEEVISLIFAAWGQRGRFDPPINLNFTYKPNRFRGVTVLCSLDANDICRLIGE